MAPKIKISAKELCADIRRGLDDRGLMGKYGVNEDQLLRLFARMIEAGAVTKADIDARSLSEKPLAQPSQRRPFACPDCGFSGPEAFDECPRCGIISRKHRERLEIKPTATDSDRNRNVSIGGIITGGVCLLLAVICFSIPIKLLDYDKVQSVKRGRVIAEYSAYDYGKIYVILGTITFCVGVVVCAKSLGFHDLTKTAYLVAGVGGGVALLAKQVLVFCLLALVALVLWTAGRVQDHFRSQNEDNDPDWG